MPLVDDDGVTRLFTITANVTAYSDGTTQVTCTYNVRGQDVTNRGLPATEPACAGGLLPARLPGDPLLPTDAYTAAGLRDYCVASSPSGPGAGPLCAGTRRHRAP